MKRLTLTLLTLAAVCTSATADTRYLAFTQTDGTERTLPLVGLSITFENGSLKASSQGEAFTLDLSTMRSMAFTAKPTGIESAQPQDKRNEVMYDLQGRRLMSIDGQQQGIYIISNGQKARKEVKR